MGDWLIDLQDGEPQSLKTVDRKDMRKLLVADFNSNS